jgi:hypothetical protein
MTCERRGDRWSLEGPIDEQANLMALLTHEENGKLVLDLGGITFINSQGVREWIRMQDAATAANIQIELRRVVVPVVNQLNIVPATRGTAKVTSFYAPYECEECDKSQVMLIDVKTHNADLDAMHPPPLMCPDCRSTLSFSNPPELFFLFLAKKK